MNMVNLCWRQVNQVCIMIPAVYCRSAYTLSHFNSINNTPSPPIGTLHPTAPWPHSYLIMSMYFFANFKNLEYSFLLFFDVLIAYQFVVFSLWRWHWHLLGTYNYMCFLTPHSYLCQQSGILHGHVNLTLD